MDRERRMEKAQERALGNLGYAIDCHPAPDFVGAVGYAGGDIVTYRVYGDGKVYVK